MLQLAEMLNESDDKPQKAESKNWLNLDKTFATIVNNIQIEIANVHIRYQDHDERGNPYSIGFTLDKLNCHSTDSNWKYCFLPSEVGKTLYKIIELNYFSVYWDHFSPHIKYTDNLNLANDLQALVCFFYFYFFSILFLLIFLFILLLLPLSFMLLFVSSISIFSILFLLIFLFILFLSSPSSPLSFMLIRLLFLLLFPCLFHAHSVSSPSPSLSPPFLSSFSFNRPPSFPSSSSRFLS